MMNDGLSLSKLPSSCACVCSSEQSGGRSFRWRNGRPSRFLRIALGLCVLTVAGCGDNAREAFKAGVFNYVSSTLTSGQFSGQLGDYLTYLLIQGALTGR